MEISIQSFHLRPGKKLLGTVQDKLMKIEKIYDRINICEVTIKKEKTADQKNCIIEAKLDVPGKIIFTKGKAESFETALNKVVYELKEQLTEYKELLNEVR